MLARSYCVSRRTSRDKIEFSHPHPAVDAKELRNYLICYPPVPERQLRLLLAEANLRNMLDRLPLISCNWIQLKCDFNWFVFATASAAAVFALKFPNQLPLSTNWWIDETWLQTPVAHYSTHLQRVIYFIPFTISTIIFNQIMRFRGKEREGSA